MIFKSGFMVVKKSILVNKETHGNLKKCRESKGETFNNVVIRLIEEYGGFIVD